MSTSRLEDSSREADLGEADLIDRWLDEGDRLSESARRSGRMPAQKRRRLADAFAELGALVERRRFSVMVGAIAVSIIAIVGLRAASHAMLRTAPAVASDEAPKSAPGASPAVQSDPAPHVVSPAPLVSAVSRVAVPVGAPSAARSSASDSSQEACETALRRERAKQAVAACDKLARESPSSAHAMVMLAHADLLDGSPGEALSLARRASFLDPTCADAYLLLGTVLRSMGRLPAARSAYESYLAAAPRDSHAADVQAILKTL
jgi:tetratricopeptide (TPR) repeat protein